MSQLMVPYNVGLIACIIAGALSAAIGWIGGRIEERKQIRAEAIARGHAEYALVDGGPKTEFKWKEKP